MITSSFTGLIQIQGGNVIQYFKGCGFHYKQSVEKKKKESDNSENTQSFETWLEAYQKQWQIVLMRTQFNVWMLSIAKNQQ